MPSICLYTFEAFPLPTKLPEAVDFVCFQNERECDHWIQKPLPIDILSFSRIRKEKILKILAWKYLPEYDVAIWCRSKDEFAKAINILKSVKDNPGKDIWRIEYTKTIDATGNLNLLSQLEKYSDEKEKETISEFFFTDTIAYSIHSPDFKKFSISWISETLKESLYDEVSFTYLLSIAKNLNVYSIQEDLSEGFDCFFKIVVPCHNSENEIRECLESILNQTFKSFKIVVVDDASTDNSVEIVEQFAKVNPDKVFLVKLDKQCYSGIARNKGIEYDKFTSKYTWFVDSDDKLYNTTTLKLLYEKASLTNADLISFNCIYIKKDKSEVHDFSVPDFADPSKALTQFGIAPWHRTVKTEKVVPFFENCIRRQDLATVFRQYANCSSVAHLNQICYVYNSRDYGKLVEPYWSLQRVWLEVKRQSQDETLPENIRDTISAYLKKYPKIFGKFEEKNPRDQIVVAMASHPPRKEGMLKAVKQLLPQCDCLCLYLNGYDEVPEEIINLSDEEIEKITVKVSCEDLKDYGKFFWFGQYPGYYLTVDDDISYPEDYCKKLVEAMKQKKNKAVVGLHGNDFRVVNGKFVVAKTKHSFDDEEKTFVPIDCIGTGVAAFYPDEMSKDFRDVLLKQYYLDNDLDMSASILVKSEGKMLYRLPTKKKFVVVNGCNKIQPLAKIHFAWEKRYMQYDLWLNRKSNNSSAAVCCAVGSEVDQVSKDFLEKTEEEYAAKGIDFYFIPIEDSVVLANSNEYKFVRFEFVKKFLERYQTVSTHPLNEKEECFDFSKEKAEETLAKIWKIKAKNFKRMNDRILKANLKKM